MSQKVRIRRVRVSGSVYLGNSPTPGGPDQPAYSSDPVTVMQWLCDGSRTRYNQHRSRRHRWVETDDEIIGSDRPGWVLQPIGSSVTDISDSQARRQFTFLTAMPTYVMQAQEKLEATDWFAAVKRRRTNAAGGRRPGAMPRFRSRKHTDATFACWFNGGRNAVFTKTGKRCGTVTITGQNPAGHHAPGCKAKWSVTIHVRLSQLIRDYTSIRVNFTRREVVFVNAPLPVTERVTTGEVRGYDRGVTHALADSDGRFIDAPDVTDLDKKRKYHQRKMAKSRIIADREHRLFHASAGYQRHKAAAGKAQSKIARIMGDWRQQTSTRIVREVDIIVFEDLKLANMTRRAKRRGVAQKRGLNRGLLSAGLGDLADLVKAKAERSETTYLVVNPAYTSQRCHQCGHTAKGNRESQARFRCQQCGHTANADTNAAQNILDDGITQTARTCAEVGSTSKTDNPDSGLATTVATVSATNHKPAPAAA